MKKSPDLVILFLTAILLLTGIVMIFSASSPTCAMLEEYNNDQYHYLKRHLLHVALAIPCFWLGSVLNLKKLEKMSLLCYVMSFLLLALVLVPGLGIVINGSRRWLGAGAARFQPAEFVKVLSIIYIAAFLCRRKEKIKEFKFFFIILALIGVLMLLIEMEPDLGTALSIAAVLVVMLFIGGANKIHLASLITLGVAGLAAMIATGHSYRLARMKSFINPWQDPQGAGYHVCQSLIAVGSGGVTGLGLGQSRQKFFYLPEQHTDFIFAVISEELGFVGAFILVMIFVLLLYRGFKIASETNDIFMRLLAVGCTFMICFQAFMNMGVVVGIVPCTGIPLPMISYGGSSLLVSMFMLGIIFNISRYCSRHGRGWEWESDEEEFDAEDSSSPENHVMAKQKSLKNNGGDRVYVPEAAAMHEPPTPEATEDSDETEKLDESDESRADGEAEDDAQSSPVEVLELKDEEPLDEASTDVDDELNVCQIDEETDSSSEENTVDNS